jgi:hypothetical protein
MLIRLKKQCKDSLNACLQYEPIISNIDRPDKYTLQQLVISLILSRSHIDEFPFQICEEENTWLFWQLRRHVKFTETRNNMYVTWCCMCNLTWKNSAPATINRDCNP